MNLGVNMKVIFLTSGAVALVTVLLLNPAGATWLQTAEPEQTMPPGVTEEFWVPLSARAGIVLSSAEINQDMRGLLFVEMDGQWINVQLTGDPRLRPLH